MQYLFILSFFVAFSQQHAQAGGNLGKSVVEGIQGTIKTHTDRALAASYPNTLTCGDPRTRIQPESYSTPIRSRPSPEQIKAQLDALINYLTGRPIATSNEDGSLDLQIESIAQRHTRIAKKIASILLRNQELLPYFKEVFNNATIYYRGLFGGILLVVNPNDDEVRTYLISHGHSQETLNELVATFSENESGNSEATAYASSLVGRPFQISPFVSAFYRFTVRLLEVQLQES